MIRKERKSWTKSEISTILDLWDTNSAAEIARKINVNPQQLQYIRLELAKAGYKLPKKHSKGFTQSLIKEVLAERGLV